MKKRSLLIVIMLLAFIVEAAAQERNYFPPPMTVDVGSFTMPFNKKYGDGGLQSQFSWNFETNGNTGEISFKWPADRWKSNMLYQIFHPVVLDENGIINERGEQKMMATSGEKTVNTGATDWALEVRRYAPPSIIIDGIPVVPPYRWSVDRNLPSDIKVEFEDVSAQFGMRSHVEIFAFANPDHDDYIIWKATQKFTGEITLPRNVSAERPDSIPDQSIRFWWPAAWSFGPSKGGTYKVISTYGFEAEDDLDSWFKRKSELVPNRSRDSLYIAYYYDADNPNSPTYPNGSSDDTGDPDRITGELYSFQVPGYTLLYADKSVTEKIDDPAQPYSMPHANIDPDIWGRSGNATKLTYRGDDARGRFPLDPITAGLQTKPGKGPMRFITVGPYTMTKNAQTGQYDSLTFVYAIGAGSMPSDSADIVGREWMAGTLSDSAKKAAILNRGMDSLYKTMDNANWAYDRISQGLTVPAAPAPPNIVVTSGPEYIEVGWNYADESYFVDPVSGRDDWAAWRIYRKRGAMFVKDPLDEGSGAKWEMIAEITDKSVRSYQDRDVTRGVDYYYAVTAVDDGADNDFPGNFGGRLESSRFANRTQLPAVPFKPGLSTTEQVRVVPNPATVVAGAVLNAGSPDKISFFNLPYKCKLSIFTETGDLVTTIDHIGTADREWDQRTDSNQYVTSGIYILAVTEAESVEGRALDNQFVKFILVR